MLWRSKDLRIHTGIHWICDTVLKQQATFNFIQRWRYIHLGGLLKVTYVSKYIWNSNLTGDKGVKKSGKIKAMNCSSVTCSQFRLFLNSKIVFYNWHTKFQLFFLFKYFCIFQPNHYTKMRTFHSILFSINTVQPAVFVLLSSSAKSAIQLSTSVRSAFQIWFQKHVLLSPALNPNIERIKSSANKESIKYQLQLQGTATETHWNWAWSTPCIYISLIQQAQATLQSR